MDSDYYLKTNLIPTTMEKRMHAQLHQVKTSTQRKKPVKIFRKSNQGLKVQSGISTSLSDTIMKYDYSLVLFFCVGLNKDPQQDMSTS